MAEAKIFMVNDTEENEEGFDFPLHKFSENDIWPPTDRRFGPNNSFVQRRLGRELLQSLFLTMLMPSERYSSTTAPSLRKKTGR